MARSYLPVLLLLGFAMVNAALMLGLSALLTRPRPTPTKQEPYESGIAPLGDARNRFSVKFYMVAMLFIIFDIETVFMIPWGVHFRQLSCEPGSAVTTRRPLSGRAISPTAVLPSSTRRRSRRPGSA